MKYIFLFILTIALQLDAQVCCSPVGNGQAGGGVSMSNWATHWPNRLFSDDSWHWMTDIHLAARGSAGNIEYGPQLNLSSELSKSFSNRSVLFLSTSLGVGSIHERVTFSQIETISYSGRFSLGSRHAIGKNGLFWTQFQLIVPSETIYIEDNFPFNSEEAVKAEVLLLKNLTMPWSHQYPAFLNDFSFTGVYQKNTERNDNILSDNLILFYASSAIHSWSPLFVGPFVQTRIEQLLAPPSIWTSQRESRWLSVVSAGFDLAITTPGWDKLKLRVGIPLWSHSTANGFPDGTQPAAYINLAINWGGLFDS